MKKIMHLIALSFLILSCKKEDNNAIYNVNEKPREVLLLGNEKHIKNRKALILFETGLKKLDTKEYQSAKDFFERANKIEPNNLTILDGLANAETVLGNIENSTKMYYENIGRDSTFINSYSNLATNFMKQRNYQGSKKMLLLGLKNGKKMNLHQKSILLLNLAISCNNLNECDNGLKYAEEALKISQNENFTELAKKIISDNNEIRKNGNCH